MLSDRMVDDAASVALSRLDLEDKSDRAVAYKLALKFLKGNVNIIEPKAKKDLYGKDHAKEDTFEEFEAQLEDIAATVDEGRMSDIDIEIHEEVLDMSEEDFVEKYSKYASEDHVRNFWNEAHNEFTEDVQEADDDEDNDELNIGADEEWDLLDPDWETKDAELDIGTGIPTDIPEPDAVIGADDEVDEPNNQELDIGTGIPTDIPNNQELDIGADDEVAKPDLDSMSFGKAFAAARKAHGGAGGVFTWKGKQYQTNIKGEKYVTDPKPVKFGSTKESFDPMGEQPFSAMSDEELADYLRVSIAEVRADREYAEEMAQEMALDHAEYGESIDRMKNLAGI